MRDRLDIDDPAEIISAAEQVAAASQAVTEHARAATKELVPLGTARCDLDHALLRILGWFRTGYTAALTSCHTRSTAINGLIAQTAHELATADDLSGAAVDRSTQRG
ncbi:hypothetical protein [Nocardia jejuensis]|uniref:hypothetical protein n=1 Tax=Nocardia jejuensis TaxID=328049 RepID=UPI000ACAEB39|nr:hypothetical protein [Nocardia jejuensis]